VSSLHAGGEGVENGRTVGHRDDLIFVIDGDGTNVAVNEEFRAGPDAMLAGTNVADWEAIPVKDASLIREQGNRGELAAAIQRDAGGQYDNPKEQEESKEDEIPGIVH